jgi:hypothetical protein
LEHRALLLVRIILLTTATESVPEVVVVRVAGRWLLRVSAFPPGLQIITECTGRGRREARCSAVTDEVALVEQLHQGVFAVAGDGAGVADGGGGILIVRVLRRGVACLAREEVLAQRAEGVGARVEGLLCMRIVSDRNQVATKERDYIGQYFPRICLQSHLGLDKPAQHVSKR